MVTAGVRVCLGVLVLVSLSYQSSISDGENKILTDVVARDGHSDNRNVNEANIDKKYDDDDDKEDVEGQDDSDETTPLEAGTHDKLSPDDDGLLNGAYYEHDEARGSDGPVDRRGLPQADNPNDSMRVGQGTRTDPESRRRRSAGAVAITAAVIAGLAALLIVGASVAHAIFGNEERCEIQIITENFLWWPLSNPRTHNKAGHIKHPAKFVPAGSKEAMLATSRGGLRKQSSYGTVSWEVNAPQISYRKRVIVMWDAPYLFLWGAKANKLAVGIIESHQDSAAMWKQMFKYDGSWDKREYKKNAEYVKYCDDTFCIRGTMGTHHYSQVVIDVFPRHAKYLARNLADQYKTMMNFKPNGY